MKHVQHESTELEIIRFQTGQIITTSNESEDNELPLMTNPQPSN